jgi:hypothetical protein
MLIGTGPMGLIFGALAAPSGLCVRLCVVLC